MALLQLGTSRIWTPVPYPAFVDTQSQEWLCIAAGWIQFLLPTQTPLLGDFFPLGDSEKVLVVLLTFLVGRTKGRWLLLSSGVSSSSRGLHGNTGWCDVHRRWKSSLHTWSCLITVVEVLCFCFVKLHKGGSVDCPLSPMECVGWSCGSMHSSCLATYKSNCKIQWNTNICIT